MALSKRYRLTVTMELHSNWSTNKMISLGRRTLLGPRKLRSPSLITGPHRLAAFSCYSSDTSTTTTLADPSPFTLRSGTHLACCYLRICSSDARLNLLLPAHFTEAENDTSVPLLDCYYQMISKKDRIKINADIDSARVLSESRDFRSREVFKAVDFFELHICVDGFHR